MRNIKITSHSVDIPYYSYYFILIIIFFCLGLPPTTATRLWSLLLRRGYSPAIFFVFFLFLYVHNWTEKLDPATRKVTPRPFLILAAWEPPKPIHFWKGHQKSGRNGVVKIFPHPRGWG